VSAKQKSAARKIKNFARKARSNMLLPNDSLIKTGSPFFESDTIGEYYTINQGFKQRERKEFYRMSANRTIWKVEQGVRFRRLFDEAMLIRQGQDEALVLNDTAVSFLEACDGERSVDEIIAAMVEHFEVSAEQLAEDLAPFIEQLAKEGIICRRPPCGRRF